MDIIVHVQGKSCVQWKNTYIFLYMDPRFMGLSPKKMNRIFFWITRQNLTLISEAKLRGYYIFARLKDMLHCITENNLFVFLNINGI